MNGAKARELVLEPHPAVPAGAWVRHACAVSRRSADGQVVTDELLWYDVPIDAGIAWRDDDAEPYLLALLLQAMHEGLDLRVEGAVSTALLANLEEFIAAWARMCPARYREVRIDVRRPVTRPAAGAEAREGAAVAAFSGGVDASFTAWRHHTRQAGHRSRSLAAAVLIHGLDIKLTDTAAFEVARSSAERTLATLGVPLLTLRTNVRSLLDGSWDDMHGSVVVSGLQFFKSKAATALLGSCEPYGELVLPWGSSPLTDPLLSSAELRVVHDGAEFSRSDKVRFLSQWPEGCDSLRVCFKVDGAGRNCLRCEKCARTLANFVVQGLRVPASLGSDPGRLGRLIRRIKLRTAAQATEWRMIARMADGRHRWRVWLPWLFTVYHFRRAWMARRRLTVG